ncbi:PilC/PilY family type IV pilus protein [Pseudomonas sp.]|uniref:PilC/PilY family type IV pilus protein n=1 Tax=Pseudomonas sp. TaxID=306 RepID=UPI0025CFAEF2|nr:PilC/PilY family type IV pilus protein [Pseudomonas sp.]
MYKKNHLRPLLVSSLLFGTLFQGGASYADDTEIFFGGSAIDQGIRPNVLFILDDSGSMAYCLDRDSSRCNGGPTRMPTMKDTFATLLNGTTGVNVGVMDLNQTSNNSRILSPVQYIEQSINTKMPTPSLASGTDDVTRQTTGTTANQLSDDSLVMGYVRNSAPNTSSITRSLSVDSTYSNNNSSYYLQGNYTCSVKAAASSSVCSGPTTTLNAQSGSGKLRYDGLFLFRNLNIPAGVTITDAKLYVTTTTDTASRTFNISAVNAKTPGAFNDSTLIDSSLFTAAISKNSVKVGTTLDHSLDVTDLLRSLKDGAPANNPVSDVALRLRSTNNNNFTYNVGDTNSSPKLVVTYSGSEDNSRTTGLRFQTVAIPQGANITSARIDFVPAGSDDRSVTFDVTAQNASNAATFTATEDFTARTKTTAASWAAPEWRTQNPPLYVQGPDVRAQVQAVVSNSAWCGNNAMAFFLTPTSGNGSRVAYSYDDGSSLQPVLKITYTGGDTGCLNPILDVSMLDAKDDGRQYYLPTTSWFGSDNPNKVSITETSVPLETTANRVSYSIIGARFQKVPVRAGATVMEAGITVTPNSASGTTGTVNVSFELSANSAAFSAADNNLGARRKTTGTSCTFTSAGSGIPVTCKVAGLATNLQSIFATANNWADGNALSVFLTQPSTSNLTLRTYENSPADAIKLNLKLQTGGLGSNSYTIRNYTNDLVQNMTADGGTPLVPALYEAAGYLTQLPNKHNNNFTSPISSACQSTFMVLLTDGQANGNTTTATRGIAGMTGTSCGNSNDDELCGRELTHWLANTDQTDFDGTNYVTTHTIGFALQANQQAQTFLDDLARNGGGKSYTANNASDLAKAFNAILQEALATNTTFVNSSAPVNSFNRQDNKDQLYFALFRPSATDRWPGNLKRYRLSTANGVATIVDADGAAAIDPNTGFFRDNSQSYWPDAQAGRDGNDIAKGGAAHQLLLPANRKLFTYYGAVPSGGVNLNADAYKLLTSNTNLTATMFEVGNTTLKDQAINYIRGLDSNGTTPRYALGDMIHSTPRLFTYGCKGYNSAGQCLTTSGDDNADQFAIVGSNEGFVQLFDTSSGVEQFGFMPEALLPNVDLLRADDRSTSQKPRRYGMDNSVTVWVNDANNNGVIYGDPTTRATTGLNDDEFVYAYASMGRGGRNIYALNITDKANPKLLWQINGGSGSFTKLGQTWSAPVKTRINVGGTLTDVLIFAGGYDPNQDTLNNGDSVYTADTQGNAIYIVNARTGALLWSASNSTGHTVNLTKMRYSMPSSVRVIDIQKDSSGALVSDSEHLADQFFVGDMGGQVWRFYINNGESGASLITPAGTSNDGVFASIGGTSAAAARRFYQEPDVALLNVNGTPALSVNIGSGYRGHPLNQVIQDRFYAFRSPVLVKPATGTSEGTLAEGGLYNATENLVQGTDATAKQAAADAFASTSGGWYIALKASGEKVLSRALTAGGQLYFNTYEPSSSNVLCKASVGRNRAYAVRLLDATPVSVPVGGSGTYADRYTNSNSEGISGDPQLYCTGNDCYVLPDPSIAPIKVPTPPLGKTYWMDTNNP